MPKTLAIAALVALAVLVPKRTAAAEGDPAAMLDAQGRLAAELLAGVLSDEPAPNVLVSPATLAAALGAVALGASDAGRASIAGGLGLGPATNGLADVLAAASGGAASHDASARMALRIVFDGGLALQPKATALLDANRIDHSTIDLDAAPAVAEINGWVKEKTEGAIASILDAPPGGGFVALGAMHFKAKWKTPFQPGSPLAPFRRGDGSSVDVPMMRLGLSSQSFRADDRFAAVDLAYADENYRMTVVAAREAAGIKAADLPALAPWLVGSGFKEGRGEVSLPRLSLADGRDVLGAMGQTGLPPERLKALTFPGFTRERVHVERILQKTAVEIDEAGTEAAAATAVVAERSIDPSFVSVVADAPFAFALRDRRNGLVLAAGIVGDPLATGE